MIRKRCYLDKPQARAIVQIFRRNQLSDLIVFLRVVNRSKRHAYQLGIDCPNDTFPRLWAKVRDVSETLVETDKQAIESIVWDTYDDNAEEGLRRKKQS